MKHEILSLKTASTVLCLIACFSACNNVENIEQNEGQPVEIKLSSSVTPESKALTPTQSTQIENGETVYVWAKKSGIAYFNAWNLTSDGGGKLSSTENKYFPTDRAALDIYTLHGNFTASDEMPASISVLEDQSVKDNYCKSDLLYAVSTNVEPSVNTITLGFKHLLSKIEINLNAGSEVVLSNVASVKVLNTQLAAEITLGTDEATATAINPTGAVADITAYKSSDSDGVYAEAIVIPQEVSGKLISVEVSGEDRPYSFHILPTELQSGKKYIFNLTVGENAEVSASELSWKE